MEGLLTFHITFHFLQQKINYICIRPTYICLYFFGLKYMFIFWTWIEESDFLNKMVLNKRHKKEQRQSQQGIAAYIVVKYSMYDAMLKFWLKYFILFYFYLITFLFWFVWFYNFKTPLINLC